MKIICLLIIFLAVPLFVSGQCRDPRSVEQMIVWDALSDVERSELWIAKLRDELKRPLDRPQRKTIEIGIGLATPEFYAAKGKFSGELAKKAADFQWRMRAYFTAIHAFEIFEQVKVPAADVDVMQRINTDCNCSTTWSWCSSGSCQSLPSPNCNETACTMTYNCGPFWGFQCNGMCCHN